MARPKGIPCSPEHKQKISKALTGKARNETGKVLTKAEISSRSRKRHPDKYTTEARRESRKRLYGSSREKHANSRLLCKYGISLEDKRKLRKEQEGLCGICKKPLPKELRMCYVEHSHKTGKVRSLSHHRCNVLLGYLEKTPEMAKLCEEYLKKHNSESGALCVGRKKI